MNEHGDKIVVSVGPQRLHGIISFPNRPASCAVLVLHPHPLYGGTMDDLVTSEVERTLLDVGLITMRFNFRAAEPGTSYVGAAGAIDDALAALDVLRDKVHVDKVGVVGYSFGGSVALHIAAIRDVGFLITLSASYDIAAEVVSFVEHLSSIICPTLLIHGSNDLVVPSSDLHRLGMMLENTRVQKILLAGEGHFYHRSLGEALDGILSFVASLCDEPPKSND
ncbi:MAG: dienelactone hydrolase family protein [Candidatus Thorarchaeota archaeon]|nr:dienelactone hydrolase family protein [Candidatus Thorarchaeota archaeon]